MTRRDVPCKGCLTRRDVVGTGAKAAAFVGLAGIGTSVVAGCGGGQSSGGGSNNAPSPSSAISTDSSGNAQMSFASYPNLQQTGGAYVVSITAASGTHTISVVRADSSTVDAVSPVCTHSGCPLNGYSGGQYLCNCHGSTFAANGSVINGPARSNLPTYQAQLTSTGVQVTVP